MDVGTLILEKGPPFSSESISISRNRKTNTYAAHRDQAYTAYHRLADRIQWQQIQVQWVLLTDYLHVAR
jgi:hypothetical protein